MHAIIIGGGIGGLAAALTLRRAGIDVQVFEQAAELREVGAGIQISPNASRILYRLGLMGAPGASYLHGIQQNLGASDRRTLSDPVLRS